MPTFFNPAANLTANRVTLGAGGGRLKDSASLTFDGAAGALAVGGATNTPTLRLQNASGGGAYDARIEAKYSVANPFNLVACNVTLMSLSNTLLGGGSAVLGFANYYGISWNGNAVVPSASPDMFLNSSGRLLLGTTADAANGRAQVATHTTPSGGYGFYDFSLYRSGAASARLTAALTTTGDLTVTKAEPWLSLSESFGGGRTYFLRVYAGAAYLGSHDDGGMVQVQTELRLKSSGGLERVISDCDGNTILRKRYTGALATVADIAACLRYHGLSA